MVNQVSVVSTMCCVECIVMNVKYPHIIIPVNSEIWGEIQYYVMMISELVSDYESVK